MTGWETVRIRRDGLPPLRFPGRLIARRDAPAGALSHGLALYAAAPANFAVEIAAWSGGQRTRCHAAMFGTLDAALSMLERHDAAADIFPPLLDGAMPAAELALRAAALRTLCKQVEARYRAGVGAFLAAIALEGPD